MLQYALLAMLVLGSSVSAAPGYLGGAPLLQSHGGYLGGHGSYLDGSHLSLSHSAPYLGYSHAPGYALAPAPLLHKYAAVPAVSYAAPVAKIAAPLSLGYKSLAPAPALAYSHAPALPYGLGHAGLGHYSLGHSTGPGFAYGHGPALAHGW